jgi:hypothetical protein
MPYDSGPMPIAGLSEVRGRMPPFSPWQLNRKAYIVIVKAFIERTRGFHLIGKFQSEYGEFGKSFEWVPLNRPAG